MNLDLTSHHPILDSPLPDTDEAAAARYVRRTADPLDVPIILAALGIGGA